MANVKPQLFTSCSPVCLLVVESYPDIVKRFGY